MINELHEFLAYLLFMLVGMAFGFMLLMYFVEMIIGVIFVILFRKIIKRI